MTVTYLQAFGIYYVSFQLGYFLMYVYNTKCQTQSNRSVKQDI